MFEIFISLFSYQWLISLSTRVLLGVTVYYFHVTYASEAVVRGVLCKEHVLRNFTKFTGKHLHQSLRGSKVAGVLFLQNTSGDCFWCFKVNLHSIILELITSCSRQVQYLNFKWTVTSWKYSHSNITQWNSLCYVAGFYSPSIKMCSTN